MPEVVVHDNLPEIPSPVQGIKESLPGMVVDESDAVQCDNTKVPPGENIPERSDCGGGNSPKATSPMSNSVKHLSSTEAQFGSQTWEEKVEEMSPENPKKAAASKKARFSSGSKSSLGDKLMRQVDAARHKQIQSKKAGRCIVNPNGKLMRKWDLVTTFALIFTAVVTPFEVAFLETSLDGLFFINRCIDMAFISDMALQFVLMYEIRDCHGIRWVKDHGSIARHYLSGWFPIDFVSSLPFDVASFLLQSDDLRKMKSLRMIRLFRLLKLVRIFRASRILARWQTAISVPFTAQSLIKFALILVIGAHWMACVWGLVGMETPGYNWIDALADNKPDGMEIKKTPAHALQLYLASLHFAVMTMTSIGYGDISPMQSTEYFMCVLFQFSGGLMWAITIASTSSIMSTMDLEVKRYRQTMDELNRMMGSRGLPEDMRHRLRKYFIEARELHDCEAFKDLLSRMSPALQGSVARVASERWLQCVWYLRHDISDRFVSNIARSLEARVYADGEILDKPATLNILSKGVCGRGGMVLRQGSVWGEDFLLTFAPLRKEMGAVSLTYMEVQSLTQADFFENLKSASPSDRLVIRKATVKLAVIRGVIRQAHRRVGRKSNKGLWGSLRGTANEECVTPPPILAPHPIISSGGSPQHGATDRPSVNAITIDVGSLEALIEKTVSACLRKHDGRRGV